MIDANLIHPEIIAAVKDAKAGSTRQFQICHMPDGSFNWFPISDSTPRNSVLVATGTAGAWSTIFVYAEDGQALQIDWSNHAN